MEFPEVGKHCSQRDCNQLDFLPYTCQYCKKTFCQDHWKAKDHDCPKYEALDVRIPVCPLCQQPVSIRRGEDANYKVDEHISKGCPSSTQKKSNSCSMKGCRTRVLVPIICPKCHLNFCVKHRLEADHACNPPPAPVPATKKLMNGFLHRGKKDSQKINTRHNNAPTKPMDSSKISGGDRAQMEQESQLRLLEEKRRNGKLNKQEQEAFALMMKSDAKQQQQQQQLMRGKRRISSTKKKADCIIS
ncbi:uncharacterized protein VTP21DRAFT_3667 [Calcarisporiella thermophila]|uniref:uncharacterized protein n=1 Tax=Calcarisporiella thermophila TaxID=911321 RepID=UPI003743D8E1